MTRHQPAHWTAGEPIAVTTYTKQGDINDIWWYSYEWSTEGELEVMVHNQLYAEMFEAADQAGMMLTAVQVYDEWWDSAVRM